jgi:peptidoglycan/LPS O-acetylase OafA/YrhL
LTVALDYLGCRLSPTVYQGFAPLHSPLLRFVISVLLLNETWVSVQAFSDQPFWSLCYELAYYVIFASFFFFTGWKRCVLLPACLLLAGIRTLLLFPIWLLGSWAFFETYSRNWRRSVHWVLFLLPAPVLYIYSAHDTVMPLLGIDLGN